MKTTFALYSKKQEIENIDSMIVALAGNPNVGKSTIFNRLTGLNQHTGNWPGKTVSNATGNFVYDKKHFTLYDLPGTYSLNANSPEEEIARDFICFGKWDKIIIIVDATSLKRNLNLLLQILEITDQVIVCVNLLDEAKRKGIVVNLNKLESILQVPVIGCVGHDKQSVDKIVPYLFKEKPELNRITPILYRQKIELAIQEVDSWIKDHKPIHLHSRWIALQFLIQDEQICQNFNFYKELNDVQKNRLQTLKEELGNTHDEISKSINIASKLIYNQVVKTDTQKINNYKIDKLLTSRITGIPIMILFLGLIFWVSIFGANIFSDQISLFFSSIEVHFTFLFSMFLPSSFVDFLINGIYRTLAWVVSVMLPPMTIFFFLFSILEDLGVLPRLAFNLDFAFSKCQACGKQALTMCMGFGCNAAGIIGTRIIDSNREKLIAICTNNFVPCNGRFPTLIAILTMFSFSSIIGPSIGLLLILLLGISLTFLSSFFLSKTLLRGDTSNFLLELTPYRKPHLFNIFISSLKNKTLALLYRAVLAAILAGVILYICIHIKAGDQSLLKIICDLLDPLGKLMGLDGVILASFILGFPANEIVMPIIIMTYLNSSTLTNYTNLVELKSLLINNSWTSLTALNMIIFTLLHWPCSTTLMTIKKETQSIKWTLVSFLLPTCFGVILCVLTTLIYNLIF